MDLESKEDERTPKEIEKQSDEDECNQDGLNERRM